MRILLDVPFLDFNGHPIADETDKNGFTLRSVLIRSALFVEAGTNPTGLDKFKGFKLAAKIDEVPLGGAANFTTDELAMLKANSGKMWLPLVVGRTWTLLDEHASDDEAAAAVN